MPRPLDSSRTATDNPWTGHELAADACRIVHQIRVKLALAPPCIQLEGDQDADDHPGATSAAAQETSWFNSLTRVGLETRPVTWKRGSPSLKKISVGMLRISNLAEVSGA